MRQQWGTGTNVRFPCLLLGEGEGMTSLFQFLTWGEVGVCPGVRPERWLRCFAHRLSGVECRSHAPYSVYAPDTLFLFQALQKWQLGFLVSL